MAGRLYARRRTAQSPGIAPAEIASLLAPIADALAAAHNAGVIHRDIKPSNIHLGRRERPFVKVLDFGIAKVVTSSTAVAASRIAGTVSYMSPEQIIGSRIDRRTDIYSLGIVLHQMLTGELPFKGESQGHIIQQHIAAPPPSLAELRPDLPPGLSGVIQRALAKLPEARQQSVQELYTEFVAAFSESHATLQPKQRTAWHEQVTEILSPQLPPTVRAVIGSDAITLNVAEQSTVITGDAPKQPAPARFITPHESPPATEPLAQPAVAVNRPLASVIYFALAGAIVFPLLSLLFARVVFGVSSFEALPNFRYVMLSIAVLGMLFGITASALRLSSRLLYFALGGAGAILLLTFLAPSFMTVDWEFSETYDPRRYLLMHNILVGAIIGAVACSLRVPATLTRTVKAYLIYGTGCAVILMLLYYLPRVTRISYLELAIRTFLRDQLNAWMVSAFVGFVIGLIVCGLRLSYKNRTRQ